MAKTSGLKIGDKSREVRQLQRDLTLVGIPLSVGRYGPKTKRGVELFQWNASTIPYRIREGHLCKANPMFHGTVSGVANQLTLDELARWVARGYKATGDLRRVNVTKLGNVYLYRTFKVLGKAADNECLLAKELVIFLAYANREAGKLGVKVQINQTFRTAKAPVRGAVVTPAENSQHLIGHAWDCNIVDGAKKNRQGSFKSGKETDKARKLIDHLQTKGMRWGGEFKNSKSEKIWDTPHFDKRLHHKTDEFQYKYFFNQLMVQNNDPIMGIRFK